MISRFIVVLHEVQLNLSLYSDLLMPSAIKPNNYPAYMRIHPVSSLRTYSLASSPPYVSAWWLRIKSMLSLNRNHVNYVLKVRELLMQTATNSWPILDVAGMVDASCASIDDVTAVQAWSIGLRLVLLRPQWNSFDFSYGLVHESVSKSFLLRQRFHILSKQRNLSWYALVAAAHFCGHFHPTADCQHFCLRNI